MILALLNNKGGVGKTTTAVNLAAAMGRGGRRVLLVDLDSQASATFSLGVPRSGLLSWSHDVLEAGGALHRWIRPSGTEGVDLVPGDLSLASADLLLADLQGREQRLRRALIPLHGGYDFIILDSPPSLSLLPINALVASDAFIIPVIPEYLALEGLVNFMTVVERVRTGIGNSSSLLGIVITQADYRVRLTEEIVGLLRDRFGDDVFDTEIRINVRLAEAPSFGKSIFDYDGSAAGAKAYEQLCNEVMRRCQRATAAGE